MAQIIRSRKEGNLFEETVWNNCQRCLIMGDLNKATLTFDAGTVVEGSVKLEKTQDVDGASRTFVFTSIDGQVTIPFGEQLLSGIKHAPKRR